MNEQEQLVLKELESKLWTAADKLRASLDASQYKHAVLGLIFVKYVSDAFMLRQEELKQDFANPDHEYFLDPEGYTAEELEQEIAIELEQRDYYKEKNVFWLPTESRWKFLQDNGPMVIGGADLVIDGKTITMPSSLCISYRHADMLNRWVCAGKPNQRLVTVQTTIWWGSVRVWD